MEKLIPNWLPSNSTWVSPFNTPLECGMRLAILLVDAYPQACDLQRLSQYDYLLVHSGDIEGGPPSLHPATPHRAGELHVRRQAIEEGLNMMMSKSVIECLPSESGLTYRAGDWALSFVGSLESSYSQALKKSSNWVLDRFGALPDKQLTTYLETRWKKWGTEFYQTSLGLVSE